ncbi:MAG TPA: hypothetical protein VGF55_31110 [Gemmataceae bacterium]
MAILTEEQKNLLILIGKPDDGSEDHFAVDGVRITRELVTLGLVKYTGKTATDADSFDLTDAGERMYRELTGDQID